MSSYNFYKVFTKDEDGFGPHCYCYSKEDALKTRTKWQELSMTKVMIKKNSF